MLKPSDTLTHREREVIDLVTIGYTNPQIALRVGTSEHMVKNWMKEILDKTGMDSRLQVALWRLSRGNE